MRKSLVADRVVELAKSHSHAVATRVHLMVALLEESDVNPSRWRAHLEVAERSLLPRGTSIDPPVFADDVLELLDECADASGALSVAERLITELSDPAGLPDEE